MIDAFTGRSELRELGARAAASDRAVVFAKPSPSLPVVAHEVAHVLQQEQCPAPADARHRIAEAESPAEREADAAAAAIRAPRRRAHAPSRR